MDSVLRALRAAGIFGVLYPAEDGYFLLRLDDNPKGAPPFAAYWIQGELRGLDKNQERFIELVITRFREWASKGKIVTGDEVWS